MFRFPWRNAAQVADDVVAEIALSLVLLVGAGLLVPSFVAVMRADRGFRTDRVLAVTVQAWQWYPKPERRVAFVREAVARLGALPGVRAAGVTSSLPLAEGIGQDEAAFHVEGQAPRPGTEAPTTHVTVATAGYLDALGICSAAVAASARTTTSAAGRWCS